MKDVEKKKDSNESKNSDETVIPNTETIDLSKSVKKLINLIEDEKCLLVSTMNWEDNILIELNYDQGTSGNVSNEKQIAFNQPTELINERIKYAGWIPSTEHRTLFSYQSKVFGKFLEISISLFQSPLTYCIPKNTNVYETHAVDQKNSL